MTGRRRLLVLAPFTPRADGHHGGSRAIGQLLGALAQRNEVAVVHLRGAGEPGMDPSLQERCALIREVPHRHSRDFARRLLRHASVALALGRGTPSWVSWWSVPAFAAAVRDAAAAWRPDVVQLEFHLMGQYLPALSDCPAPRVLVQHEPGLVAAPQHGSFRARLERRAWRRYESDVLSRVDRVVVFTNRDADAVKETAGPTPVVCIPLGTELPAPFTVASGTDDATVLFVGNYVHAPNIDAARRLARSIWPRVRRARPTAHLLLLGADPPGDLRGDVSAGIEVTGRVPDVRPYLERANVVVAPLRTGGGMRVKVLEALAAGKAVVASPLAIEGLDVLDGETVRVAESDEQFAAAIVELLDHAGLRQRLGSRARAWAAESLAWSRVAERYEAMYSALPGRRADISGGRGRSASPGR